VYFDFEGPGLMLAAFWIYSINTCAGCYCIFIPEKLFMKNVLIILVFAQPILTLSWVFFSAFCPHKND
jgi:hypothetical protein